MPDLLLELLSEEVPAGLQEIAANQLSDYIISALDELEIKHWDWTYNINAKAPWLLSVESSKLMKNGGSIVNISSYAAISGVKDIHLYAASKAAIKTIITALSKDLFKNKIKIFSILPKHINTPTFRRNNNIKTEKDLVLFKRKKKIKTPEEFADFVYKKIVGGFNTYNNSEIFYDYF